MKKNRIHQLQRLLGMAGVAFILLIIPANGGPFATSVDRVPPTQFTPIDKSSLPHALQSETGVPFDTLIHFQENGEHFIYASTPPEGSGAFMTEAIFWIAPDGAVHPIVFEPAAWAYENEVDEAEFVLAGGPGILFSNGSLRFEFYIAGKGDPHCCPTAGRISGTYKVVGEKRIDPESKEWGCTFKLVIDEYNRDIVSSDQSNIGGRK